MEAFQAFLGDDFCFFPSSHIVARTPRKRPIMTSDHADKMEITVVFQCPPLGRIGERPLLGFSFFILPLFSLPWAGAALRLVSDIPEMVLGISDTNFLHRGQSREKEQHPSGSYIHTLHAAEGWLAPPATIITHAHRTVSMSLSASVHRPRLSLVARNGCYVSS